jgi:hypothetical protein
MNHLKFRAFGDKNNTLIVCQQKMGAHSGIFLLHCHIFLASTQQGTAFQTTYNTITRFIFHLHLPPTESHHETVDPMILLRRFAFTPKKATFATGKSYTTSSC